MRVKPAFRVYKAVVHRGQRRLDAENSVCLLLPQFRHGTDEVRAKFAADFFGELANFFLKRAVAELQIVIIHQIFHALNGKWNADGDADGPDRKDLHRALNAHGTAGAETFKRRKPNHLRFVKEEMARA